jgi:hypothetical protein
MSEPNQKQPGTPSAVPDAKVQGEGDYRAARRHREEAEEFISHHDVEKLAKQAAPQSALEARELALAEERARNRSKGDESADVAAMYPGRSVDDKP